MNLNQSLELKLKTTLNILLKQQLEVLTLQTTELEKLLNEELLINPFLKVIQKKPPVNFEEIREIDVPYSPSEYEEIIKNVKLEFEGEELKIALELLNNIDEKGFLSKNVEELAFNLGIPAEKVENVRRKITKIEPLGFCCKDTFEFLEVQIEEYFPEESEKLLKELQEAKEGKNISKEAKEKLSRLKIYPVSQNSVNYRISKVDAVIEEENGELFIYLYDDLFEIDINEETLEHYRKAKGEVKRYLKEFYERYLNLYKAMNLRKENLRKILDIVSQRQKEFLLGKGELKPLSLSEVSERLNIHVSTVSRIVNSKYVKTPVGTYLLKFFFARESSGGLSQDELMNRIKEIIESEDKKKPLSDEQIAKILQREGFKVARRTVAKYREILGIPSSRERKVS